jgi:hypothetical protein
MLSTSISEEDRQTIERFIEALLGSGWCRPVPAVLSEPEAYFARTLPAQDFRIAPHAMLCGPPDAEGHAPWRPVDSPIDEAMVTGFERFLMTPLPPLFKAYLTQKCLLGMDLCEGTLPDIDPRRPLEWLEWCAVRRKEKTYVLAPGLIPFTYGPARLSTLCFDARRPDPREDQPVIMVKDDGGIGVGGCNPDAGLGRQVFDSFSSYLIFLQNWLVYQSIGSDLFFLPWLRRAGKPEPPLYYYA